MKRKEPSGEQIKEFWEWCGFKEIVSKETWWYERYKETNHWWEASDGIRCKKLPPTDLNNLFKYAIIKLDIDTKREVFNEWVEDMLVNLEKDVAILLFGVINAKRKVELEVKDGS